MGLKASVNNNGANLAHDFGPEVKINAVGLGVTRTAALRPEIKVITLAPTTVKNIYRRKLFIITYYI